MTASVTQINIKDATGQVRAFNAIDQSGVGTGPFTLVHALASSTGGVVSAPAPGTAGAPSADVMSVQGVGGTPLPTGGLSARPGASFTTPAGTTGYSIGDLIANSGTAASVVPLTLAAARAADKTGRIHRVRVKTTETGAAGATVRAHFYEADPSASSGITNGDNGVWLTKEATWIGHCDVVLDKHFSDFEKGIGAPASGSEIIFAPAAGTQNLFVLIEARSTFTPVGAKIWTVVAEVLQD